MNCALVVGAITEARWRPLHCGEHGANVAYVDRHRGDHVTAIADAWASHLEITARARQVAAQSAARLSVPYSSICTYDSGAMYGCAPMCERIARFRITHEISCYGWFVIDVCDSHLRPTLGRIHPGRAISEAIPSLR